MEFGLTLAQYVSKIALDKVPQRDIDVAKLAIMEECGFKVTRNPSEMGKLLKALL